MGVTTTTGSASTYTAIATYTIPSATTSYTFTSIPTTYTDLILVSNFGTSTAGPFTIRVGNGTVDTGSNYSRTCVYGTGSAIASFRETSQTYANTANSSTNLVANSVTQFMNYSNTSVYKTFIDRNGNTTANTVQANIYLWRSTAAINTIQVFNSNGYNLLAGSTFTLYGIKAA
jgi:hypothetical protein